MSFSEFIFRQAQYDILINQSSSVNSKTDSTGTSK